MGHLDDDNVKHHNEEGVRALLGTLETAIVAVEKGEKNEDACCTLVAPPGAMKGAGIRPYLASVKENGDRIYLLNVRQAQKLADRIRDAVEP